MEEVVAVLMDHLEEVTVMDLDMVLEVEEVASAADSALDLEMVHLSNSTKTLSLPK